MFGFGKKRGRELPLDDELAICNKAMSVLWSCKNIKHWIGAANYFENMYKYLGWDQSYYGIRKIRIYNDKLHEHGDKIAAGEKEQTKYPSNQEESDEVI